MKTSTANPSPSRFQARLKYALLILSLGLMAVGFSNIGQGEFWNLARPGGVILFGMFLIDMALFKENALYVAQTKHPAS